MVTSEPVLYRQFLGHRARSAAAQAWTDEDTTGPTVATGSGPSAPAEAAPGDLSGD